MSKIRMDRLLVLMAEGSRQQVQKIIRSGRVRADDNIIKDPSAHVDTMQHITLDEKPLDTRLTRHVIMNKPSGVLTACEDRKAKTVMDLLPPVYKTLECMPVGRLDKDTEGLLLFTTDGTLNHRLLAPEHEIWKTYEALVEGKLSAADVRAFETGIQLKDFKALPARLEILESGDMESRALCHVCEGKYHQVKRMFASRRHEVIHLRRKAFGPLSLDETLPAGAYRELTNEEAALLYQAAGCKEQAIE